MKCYLLSEPKIRGYRKGILSLWLHNDMFWLSEQRLVDQANAIRRHSWMTELETEKLERKVTGSDSFLVEMAGSVVALPDHVGEDVRSVLPEMGAKEQADKYSITVKRLNLVIEELKERITAIPAKGRRYQGQVDRTDKTDYMKIIKGSFIGK